MASKLYFIQSPMNASKTTMLLTKAHSFEERHIPFLCLKSTIDDRDGQDIIKSRIGISRECISINTEDDIFDLINNYNVNASLQLMETPKWILVDECQFLTSKQVDELAKVVDKFEINVICYGLRTDFTTHLFEGSKRLMEIADNIEEIKLSCHCGRKAIINARIDKEGKLIHEGEQILIGGEELYLPLCRKCYNEMLENEKNKIVNEKN